MFVLPLCYANADAPSYDIHYRCFITLPLSDFQQMQKPFHESQNMTKVHKSGLIGHAVCRDDGSGIVTGPLTP